ncbi:MAG: sulfotransferase [Geminicoccaceae bacterium]
MIGRFLRDPRIRLTASHMRLNQLASVARRIIGLPAWREADYLPPLGADELAILQRLAREIRGPSARSAIFVHGVQPRSGTNFVANALSLHPETTAFPDDIWEYPLLHMAPGARALRDEILSLFPANEDKLPPLAPLVLVAAGWLRSLEQRHPEGRLLFKSPHVRGLSLFSALFPDDRLVVCLRDGRDIAASSEATFKDGLLGKSFRQLAHEWRQATDAALDLADSGSGPFPLLRYEDLVADPPGTMHGLLRELGLDPASYPFEKLEALPVFGSSTDERKDDDRWRPRERDRDFSPVGRWTDWPDAKKKRFDRIAGATLKRAGYA